MMLTSPTHTDLRLAVARCAPLLWAIAIGAVTYGVAVWTSLGQLIDQLILDFCRTLSSVTPVPAVLRPEFVDQPLLWVVIGCAVIGGASAPWWISGIRRPIRRELLCLATLLMFPPIAIIGARTLRDDVLTRPQLHSWITETTNSAPSGHAAAAMATAVVLILVTPRRFRMWTAVAVGTWVVVIDYGLIADGWHRVSDVVISTVLVAGVGALLPDPHAGRPAGSPRVWERWLPALIVVAPVLVVATYYPSMFAIVTALGIAAVVATSVHVMARSVAARTSAPSAPHTYIERQTREPMHLTG